MGTSIYGDTGGLLNNSSNCYRGIWSDIIKVGQFIEAAGFGLVRSFRKSACLGNSTRFWLDTWMGNSPLFSRFSILFALDINKQWLISDRITPPNQPLSFSWEWQHPPRGREISEFVELTVILENLAPFPNHPDNLVSFYK